MQTQLNDLLASGDARAALEGLVTAYGDALTRFCAGLVGSAAEGEELVQDTLVAALAALPTYRGASPRAWVFGIARNKAASHLRKRERRRGLFARWQPRLEDVRPHERSDARLVVERGLASLRPKQREAVLLRYQQGFDASEVGEILGISHAAARKRISVGVQSLRKVLDTDLTRLAANTHTTPPMTQATAHDTTNTPGQNDIGDIGDNGDIQQHLPATGRVHAL